MILIHAIDGLDIEGSDKTCRIVAVHPITWIDLIPNNSALIVIEYMGYLSSFFIKKLSKAMGDALRTTPFMIHPALDIPMKKRNSPVFPPESYRAASSVIYFFTTSPGGTSRRSENCTSWRPVERIYPGFFMKNGG